MSGDDANPDLDDATDTLDQLEEAKNEAIGHCQHRTACRLASEIKRRARSERRLRPYALALHTLTNLATNLLDPEQGREAAIEFLDGSAPARPCSHCEAGRRVAERRDANRSSARCNGGR